MIRKLEYTRPNTGRGFEVNTLDLKAVDSIIITPSDSTFTETQIQDFDYMHGLFGDEIYPLNKVMEVSPQNEEAERIDTVLHSSYQSHAGRYRFKFKYDWTLSFMSIVDSFSNQDVNIIFGYKNKKLIVTSDDDGATFRGFGTNDFQVEKPDLFINNTTETFVELADSEEVYRRGYEIEINYRPSKLDKLFLNVTANLTDDGAGTQSMTLDISYNNQSIDDIDASEITITDDYNGDISFSLFSYLGGIYQLSGFDKTLSRGVVCINADIYLGRARYAVQIVVTVEDLFLYEDSVDVLEIEDSIDVLIFEN